MSIIESIRAFISGCPFLDEFDAVVGVEYLPEDEKSYIVGVSATNDPIVKKYMNGDRVMKFDFVFASREYFGRDNVGNMEVADFYEHFSKWLQECDMNGKLPELSGGKESRHIKALTNGYVFNQTETKAQYQIQCQLTYYQKRTGGI